LQTEFLPVLLSGLQEVMDDIGDKRMARPWLAIYPNGGEIYDHISRTWKANGAVDKANVWGDKLGEIVKEVAKQRTWGGVLVGGCCKTGPEEINVLSHLPLG
jgi:homocysteine S-methyltransferase